MENRARYLAEQFILHTHKNVFLTGKAGTGKTTLLHDIIKKTTKKAVVVAPTGVAAINAGGMTIHSTFQLPLTAFVPTIDFVDPQLCTNITTLASKQKMRKEKRKLIVEMELLIIDEISMVRADILDAVDLTMRRIRRSPLAFGGVQLLVIGDLFQLAPILRNNVAPILGKYYKSPFFFEAKSWIASEPVIIELTKVYRQADQVFVDILNRIRNGVTRKDDLDRLNENFSESPNQDGVITLTTHNNKADKINQERLYDLPDKSWQLSATVSGQFSESSYPAAENIKLKKGAQIMFIRNHKDGLYYNGKLGVVTGRENEELFIKTFDESQTIRVIKEEWKNVKYKVNAQTKEIEQEEVGSFVQYPIKLAWAVTVHKSQGLTFDRAIVDLESTFAPGQLYVALSRCRSLDGLILSSKISEKNVIADRRILDFYKINRLEDGIDNILEKEKQKYEDVILVNKFSFRRILNSIDDWGEYIDEKELPSKLEINKLKKKLSKHLTDLEQVASTFRKQLTGICTQIYNEQVDESAIVERTEKAILYFTDQLYDKLILQLDPHIQKFKIKSKTRPYIRITRELVDEIWIVINSLYDLQHRGKSLFTSDRKHKRVKYFDPDQKPEKPKVQKGETYRISLELFKQGKSIEEIAYARDMAKATIEGHMTKWVKEKEISLFELISEKRAKLIWEKIEGISEQPFSELMRAVPFEVSFSELRWVRAWYAQS